MASTEKWDQRFLALAEHVAGWSKDPSTKVGAVIVNGKRIVSIGFNGFPQGVDDRVERLRDRPGRLLMTVHAETNAILFARSRLDGNTIYTVPFPPCAACAGLIVQSGITRVVARRAESVLASRWAESLDCAVAMFEDAGVEVAYY